MKLAKAGIPVFLVNTRSERPFIPAWDRLDAAVTEAEREFERRTFHDKHGLAPSRVAANLN